eukprot:scaffold105025_cov15-Tisochrysis_lutea.AAC.1
MAVVGTHAAMEDGVNSLGGYFAAKAGKRHQLRMAMATSMAVAGMHTACEVEWRLEIGGCSAGGRSKRQLSSLAVA